MTTEGSWPRQPDPKFAEVTKSGNSTRNESPNVDAINLLTQNSPDLRAKFRSLDTQEC